jgi:hypothetical protein
MARTNRISFRVNEKERATLHLFADHNHVVPSQALRMLIELCPALAQAGRENHAAQKSDVQSRQ